METGVVTIQEPVSTKTNVGGAPAGVIPDNSSMEVHKVSVQKPVIEENHTEAKHSPEQEEEIGHISKAHEEIPIKTDEVKEEKDSRTVETSVNETEAEHNTTVSVEEISRNGDNIVNETVPEDQIATNGESLQHDIETTKRVLLEVKKEEEEAEPLYKTDANIVDNEETTAHESKSLNGDNHQEERAEPVEAIRNSDDAEQISREVTVDKENEEEITQNTEEIQESHGVIETSKIQGEDIESKASLEPKDDVDHSSKDIEEHEHVLERDVPQCKTLEAEAVETKEETKPSLDLKEDKEKEETETVKTVISADEVRSSAVQEEEFGEHTKPCSSEIKDESHGREESVEVKSQETVQEESTEEKHEDLLDVPSTESEKYQENEPQTALVSNTERHEKFEEIPSDLALNVDKVDGTQIMEEKRGLDSNGVEAEQIDRNRTDETEESPVAKQVSLPDVEPVEQMQKPSLDSPSQVSEETSKTVDEKIKEKPEEEKVTLHQEDQEEGSYGLETKEETVSVPECIELGEEPQEERSVIDLTPLQGESSQPNEQKEETKLEKHKPRNEEVKSDEVIEVSSASPSKEMEGETVVEAEKTENKKENDDEQAADKIQKSLETVEKVESHSSLPSSEEQERGTVFEKIEAKKVKEEEPMVQIKSEDDATKSHERQEEFSKDVEMKETTVVQAEQTRDIRLSLTEICSLDQSQPEEQVKETCSRDEQKKEISNETNAVNSTEAAVEETATNGESLHDVETTESVLLEMEKEEEETEIKTDAEPRLDGIEKEEKEIVKTVEEDAMIVNNEETTAHESKSFEGDNHQEKNAKPVEAAKNLDDAEKISREVLVDRETEEDTTQKTEEVQESSRVIETPTIQGASKASLELKEEVDQSSKDTVEHEHVLGRDIPQCETLEAEVVEAKEETKPSLDLKEDKEKEAKPSDQVGVQAEEFGEHTEPCSLEIKDASQGSEESFEVKSKETVQDESTEMKHEDLLDAPSGESEKLQENKPQKTLVLKIESQAKSEEIPLDLALKVDKEELKDKKNVDKVDGTQTIEEQRGLNLDDREAEQIDRNITEESPVEHPVSVPVQKPSLESSLELTEETSKTINEKLEDKPKEEGQEEGSYGLEIKEETIHNQTLLDVESVIFGSELSEETSETVDEKIEDKPKEEVTLHQEGQDEGSNELETKEETVSVPESRELGEQAHEEESCLQNEQENEIFLQKEYEPTKEEVSNDQQSPVGETFDEVIQISSVSPSEGPENETVVEAEKIGEEQVADKIQKISETVEIVEPHSSLPSSSKEQDHGIVSEKTDDEKVKDAEPTGDMSEKGLEISETTPLSLPSVDQKEDVKAFDEEIQIPSVALSLDEQKKVTSTEKGKTKAKETEDDKQDEHVDSSTLTAATEKGDEEITVGTSKLSETVCMQQEEFGTLEVTKLEELKEDNSQEIAETTEAIEATSDQTLPIETSQPDNTHSSKLVSEQDDDQTPKQVEEIYEEEHKVEATGDQNLPVETSQAYQSPSSDLVSTLNDQTPKQVEETHEEETKEEHKLQAEEILPTEIIPRESSDGALVSMLASKEDGQVTLQEDNCADDVRETKDTQEERPVSVEIEESVGETKPKEPEDEMRDEHVETPTSSIILEKNDNETLIAEAKKGDDDINETERTVALGSSGTSATSENVCIKQEEFVNHEAPKLEESKEETSQEIPETTKAIETMSDQTLPIETSQVDQTLSSKLVPGLDDQTPRQFEEIHEEEEAKEEQKLKVAVDQILLVETSQADQTPSLVSEQDDQIPKRVEEIHEEETKETQKVQAEEILFTETVPRESFSEAPVSMLAPGEDEQVSPQEGNCAGDTQEERHVSVETEEKVGETNPKESEAEEREKSNDQVETSRKLTEVEDESTKKTDVEVAELTNDYPTDEAEHGDENYSTLPVVGILTELQTTLETERTINNSASSGENMIKEPADQEQKTGDAEVESNEKDSATRIIEANRLQQDESGETEKFQEENGLAGKCLPVEEISLQEEHKEKVMVQDGISREFEFNVEEKLHEETREIAECKEEISADPSLTEVLSGEKILIPSSALPSEELEHLNSDEKQEDREPQQDFNGSTSEKIILQEEHLRDFDTSKKEKKEETHETVKEEDQIVDIKDEKNDDEEQEIVSSEVKKDKEDASELGVGNDFVSRDVEKEEAPHSVFEYEEEINKVVTSEEQTTDPVGVITKASEAEHESNEEHVKSQVISDDSKSSNDRDFSTEQAPKDQREEVTADNSLTKEALAEQIQVPSSRVLDDFQENSNLEADRDLSVQKPSELIQSHQSPNQVEETSFEVRKAQEDKKEETVDALITNVQVQDQPKDFEAPAIQKEISEQEQKSNDTTEVQEDIGTNIKPEVRDDEIRGDGHDSVVALKEGTGLIEEKRDVEHVKTELEDAIKHGVSIEEKNNMSEKIDREATKEINQEESKQTYTVKEEIREEEKETNQECFSNVQKTDDAINKTTPAIGEIGSLSSVSKTQDKAEQKDEVPNQQNREIADEVPKIAEEVQQKDGESENTKGLFSEVKECEPTSNEPARKSLSDLIQKVKGIDKIEDATTEPHMKEELKTEEEKDDGDHEHKDDKTSPDSIVMVEAKDTVSIIKTHKKSQGILSGVGSKVKHSIFKVKKVLTGKSSHTTKPSSPK